MSDFRREISNRIAQTRGEISSAAEAGDDYLVEVRLGELESLARIAAEHGVQVDGVEQAVACYGPHAPARRLAWLAPEP